jgi:hypothetical protein
MRAAEKCLLASILVVAFMSFSALSQAAVISEFMPDPDDGCRDRSEWVEIFVDGPWTGNVSLDTGKGAKAINGTFAEGEYLIITRDASAFMEMWNLSEAGIIEDASMSLSNEADNVTLYDNSVEVQRIEYSDPGNNVSYGLCDGLLSLQNVSTPGIENACPSGNSNNTNQTNENNETNETVAGSCSLSLSIDSPGIFLSGRKQKYYLILKDDNCSEKDVVIEYWIEDVFGNVVKAKYNTTQSLGCEKNVSREWTAPDAEGSEACYIKARIAYAGCDDDNPLDNGDEELAAIKGSEPAAESNIEILEVRAGSDGKAAFGETIEVSLSVYRGDTAKNAVDVRIESPQGKKAAETNLNVYEKFSGHEISVPLQIKPNCGGDFPDGVYTIKAEGIDSYDEASVEIGGISASLCKTKTVSSGCSPAPCPPCQCGNVSRTAANATAAEAHENETYKSAGNRSGGVQADALEGVEKARNSSGSPAADETEGLRVPTGGMVSAGEENWLSSALAGIMDFFKNLFGL